MSQTSNAAWHSVLPWISLWSYTIICTETCLLTDHKLVNRQTQTQICSEHGQTQPQAHTQTHTHTCAHARTHTHACTHTHTHNTHITYNTHNTHNTHTHNTHTHAHTHTHNTQHTHTHTHARTHSQLYRICPHRHQQHVCRASNIGILDTQHRADY